MDELSNKIKRELQEILDPPGVRAKRQLDRMGKILLGADATPSKANYEKMAMMVAKSMDRMPACFWIKLFEIAQQMTNPILHNLNCTNWVSADEKCKAGYEMSDCKRSCKDYVGEKVNYSDETICNGDCSQHHTGPVDA